MPDPLTLVEHQWVAIEVTPVVLLRRRTGEVTVIADPDEETDIQVGCARCDATPREGWSTLCPTEEEN